MADQLQRRKLDRYPGRIYGLLHSMFFTIGVAATVSFVLLVITISRVMNYTPPPLPSKMVLSYSFKSGLAEMISKPSLEQPLLRPATTLHDIIDALESGSKDTRVKGFVARIENVSFSLAQTQELRDALDAFRKSGKFAYVYSDSYGGFSAGMADYYLASAFDKVWLQPVGSVALTGIAAEVPFFKDLFDKVGVSADFGHKGLYKSAPESLTRSGMSDPHREMITSMVASLSDQMVRGIAADRKMTAEQIKKLVDNAPYDDETALKEKLVDKIGYYDQMVDAAKDAAGDKAIELVDVMKYDLVSNTENMDMGMHGFVSKFAHNDEPELAKKNKQKIALIYGTGEISAYGGGHSGFGGEGGMRSGKIVEAFREAQKDDDVVAVVFRIDSPGGEPSAAETIRRAIIQTKEKGKPVIVSMGGAAASGGYWIAAAADKIVAQPATITGSIGVFGGKIEFSGLWQKLGVNWEGSAQGAHAAMWTSNRRFTDEERAHFEAMLESIYKGFISRVAEGRHMTAEQVEAVAEGRVWTGEQAKERGLVDELGGLKLAFALAKKAAKIPEATKVAVERFPARKSTLELFFELASDGSASLEPMNFSAKDILLSLPRQWAAEQSGAALKMPDVYIQ